jgi:hypothetical protein
MNKTMRQNQQKTLRDQYVSKYTPTCPGLSTVRPGIWVAAKQETVRKTVRKIDPEVREPNGR